MAVLLEAKDRGGMAREHIEHVPDLVDQVVLMDQSQPLSNHALDTAFTTLPITIVHIPKEAVRNSLFINMDNDFQIDMSLAVLHELTVAARKSPMEEQDSRAISKEEYVALRPLIVKGMRAREALQVVRRLLLKSTKD